MAVNNIERAKKRIDMEDKRQSALAQKRALEEEKRLFAQNGLDEKYKELEQDRKTAPIVIDLIDLDDMINNPKLLEDHPNQYGEVTEEERKKIFESLKEDLPILARDPQRLIKGVNNPINKADSVKKQLQDWGRTVEVLDALKKDIRDNFQVATPRYSAYVCSCCGKPKQLDEFPKAWTPINAAFMDVNGFLHAGWCKDCAKKLFEYYYLVKTNKNPELSMEMWCCTTNTYWDIEFFKEAQIRQQNNSMTQHIVSEYLGVMMRKTVNHGLTYWDSPTIKNRNITIIHGENNELETKLIYDKSALDKVHVGEETTILDVSSIDATENKFGIPMEWSKEDAKNKIKIVKMVGYDPFDYEDDEDKKILYRDFLNILELGMENDFTKLQAAIQIVSSFYRIRKFDKLFVKRQKEGASPAELKGISELKSKELNSITQFTKDHGFAERYALGKKNGENSLSGVMNKMSNAQYEKSILNAYDIKMSKSLQQIADANFKAINTQLSMGESDMYKIIQDQLLTIKNLRNDVDDLKEELRQANIKAVENNLRQEMKQKGIVDDD